MENAQTTALEPTAEVVMDTLTDALAPDASGVLSQQTLFLQAALVLLAALVLGGVFCRRLLPYLARLAKKREHNIVAILFESIAAPLYAFLMVSVLYFIFMMFSFFQPAWAGELLGVLYRFAVIATITWFGLNCSRLFEPLVQHLSPPTIDESTRRTASGFLRNIWRVFVLLLAGITLLDLLGFNVSSLVAGVGLVGLTVSLAAQSSANNFFCGLIIVLERPISVGDWVKIGGMEGEVESVTLRSTTLRTLDKCLVTIANSEVCGGIIENYSRRPTRLYDFKLGVTYDTSRAKLEALMADIEAMLRADPEVVAESVQVELWGFGDSSIDILVRCQVTAPALPDFLRAQNRLNLSLMDVMEKNACSFAFPSTSVYLEKTGKET